MTSRKFIHHQVTESDIIMQDGEDQDVANGASSDQDTNYNSAADLVPLPVFQHVEKPRLAGIMTSQFFRGHAPSVFVPFPPPLWSLRRPVPSAKSFEAGPADPPRDARSRRWSSLPLGLWVAPGD